MNTWIFDHERHKLRRITTYGEELEPTIILHEILECRVRCNPYSMSLIYDSLDAPTHHLWIYKVNKRNADIPFKSFPNFKKGYISQLHDHGIYFEVLHANMHCAASAKYGLATK